MRALVATPLVVLGASVASQIAFADVNKTNLYADDRGALVSEYDELYSAGGLSTQVSASVSLDIDGNGTYDALTDGLLLLRGMFGLSGDALISNAIATDATYTSSADILARLENISGVVDIDANGQIDALTDGLIILRYLFGLRGDALLAGVVAGNGGRDTASAIEAYVGLLVPEVDDNSHSAETETIYVRLNDQPFTAPHYLFSTTINGPAQALVLNKGGSYKFVRTDSGHPFNIGSGWKDAQEGLQITSTSSTNLVAEVGSIEAGQSITVTIPADFTAATLTYYCFTHFSMNTTVAISDNQFSGNDVEAPVLTSEASFSVAVNQTAIGRVTASDVDSAVISFTVSGPNLAIDATSGLLSFVFAPDFEARSSYTATVTASDGTNSISQVVTVTVTDIDDVAPVFVSAASFSAAENQTAIGTVIATDIDSSSIQFTVSGADLAIDSSSGVLSFLSAPDFEARSSYTATVTAFDGINSMTQAITVTVTDVVEGEHSGNTSGAFELLGSRVTLQDYNPASKIITTNQFDLVMVDGVASADLSAAPLNLANIKNGIASPVGDYLEAMLRFELDDALPLISGAGTVDLYVTTGSDGVRASNESQLHCQLQIRWSSDGVSASVIEPEQSIVLKVNRSGLNIKTTINEFDVMAVSVDELTGVKTLDIKLLSALSEGARVAGGLLDSLLVPRTLHIKVATSLPVNDSGGAAVSEFDSIIRLAN